MVRPSHSSTPQSPYMYAELFELRFRHDRFEIFVYIVYTYIDQNALENSLLCLFFIRKVGITFS